VETSAYTVAARPIAALAFFVRPTNVVPLCVLGLFLLLRAPRQVMWAALAALPVVALFVDMNVSAYGAILAPYFLPNRANLSSMTLNANLPQALLAKLDLAGSRAARLLSIFPATLHAFGVANERRRARISASSVPF